MLKAAEMMLPLRESSGLAANISESDSRRAMTKELWPQGACDVEQWRGLFRDAGEGKRITSVAYISIARVGFCRRLLISVHGRDRLRN